MFLMASKKTIAAVFDASSAALFRLCSNSIILLDIPIPLNLDFISFASSGHGIKIAGFL